MTTQLKLIDFGAYDLRSMKIRDTQRRAAYIADQQARLNEHMQEFKLLSKAIKNDRRASS